MRITPVKTPETVKRFFPNYTWEVSKNNNEKVIYLTFDDGPTPEITDWTLDVLKTYNAKATFFCIGKNVEKYPDIFKRIMTEGHAVGNHTHNHLKGWRTNTEDYLKNTQKASHYISSKLFRPPYGQIRPKQGRELHKLGYKIIMWSVLSFDWEQTLNEDDCYHNVINNTTSGDIILFHDSIKASRNLYYVLPKVLAYYKKEGFRFKRIPE